MLKGNESESPNTNNGALEKPQDPVVVAIESKLAEVRQFGGTTGEAAVSMYEKLLEKVNEGSQAAYKQAAKEFGLEIVAPGARKLDSPQMKSKSLSEEERRDIDTHLDAFD